MKHPQQSWSLVIEGPFHGEFNMALDEAYLDFVSAPLLRIYQFLEPMLSIGYFQKWKEVSPDTKFVRRYTGGGAVQHGKDCVYALVIPKDHFFCKVAATDTYFSIHKAIGVGISKLGLETTLYGGEKKQEGAFCFQKPVKHDLMWGQEKIAGAAQRRNRKGLLHQGSVQLPKGIFFDEMRRAIVRGFEETFGVYFQQDEISESVWSLAKELELKKYKTEAWNYMR
ncbi:lipoate--protein ligase [Methylacidiphilum kamchatkense Kam1]|uniref:Lipoate--protein ligase n=1 Tax=Methylacidiphilum kamchatkense Kam1 TaxID=1202785 RepID=A0A0C1V5R9_9BACT|nr:biotin/lipoate A/B protein ligase family protein [Methylacidiphilum kamchatkense]KIE59090.1 lipoate--protein ligase [Methylacidiphilum kamchatkense Kam1]QDQ42997.1 lipoate-protein ligase A [Methylacidiphilum kamchatkense Kam1]